MPVRKALLAVMAAVAMGCSSSGTDRPTGSSAPGTTRFQRPQAELPEARTEVAGAAWNGRIAVAGGLLADGKVSRRLDLFVPRVNLWEAGPDLPQPLHHLGMAVLGDRLYVAGGYTVAAGSEWTAVATVHSLGPGESTWRTEPSLTRPRGAHGLAAAGGRLVVAGGVTGGLVGTTESWAPGEPAWRPGPDLAQAREHLAMAATGGRAYAIAGRLGGLDQNLRTVESWAPGEASWRAEPQLNDTRGGTSAAEINGKICVAGGENPTATIASVECLTPSARRWERAPSLATPRHGLAVVALGATLRVIGGGAQPGLFVSTTHEVVEVG